MNHEHSIRHPNECDGEIKVRSPQHAAMLSLVMSGLGHIYCGALVTGLVWAAISSVSGLLSLWMLATHRLSVLWIPIALVMAGAAIHAWFTAKNCPADYRLKPWNRWYVYLLFIGLFSVGGLGHALVIRDHYIEAFFIPNDSMSPTIKRGDRVLANKRAYRDNGVKVGDIVIFASPEKPSFTFIKRVVALSGDKVEIAGGQLIVNGQSVSSHAGKETPDFGPFDVPEFNCFVLGDNVDKSKDSRHFGPVPLATVSGRASIIYWPRIEKLGQNDSAD
jgi:signal peptidase I